jgi:uncharacterized protein (DUF58 family)
MELAGILWGCTFTLLCFYLLLANQITKTLLRRFFDKSPDPVDFTLLTDGVFPGSAASARVYADLPRFYAPGLRIGFEISLEFLGRKALCLTSDLKGGRNRQSFEFSPPFRGSYQSREARINVTDLLGFTRSSVRLPLVERLLVFPAVRPEDAPRPPFVEGGEEADKPKRTRRSEELLEVRKYFPGDDIRKVHWKVYAHTSELFLRIGEETPPPESCFLVILDPAPTRAIPDRLAADYLDMLVERCAAVMMEMLNRGYQVFFALCDSGQTREITFEKNRQLLCQLAGIWWNDRYALDLPQRRRFQTLLFSSPGSGNLPRLFEELAKTGGDIALFLPDFYETGEISDRPGLGWFFFQQPGGYPEQTAAIDKEELRFFRDAVDREIRRWRGKGKRKVVVETI